MAYERSPNEKAISDSGGEGIEIVAASAAPTDYQLALLQIIESAASDPRQLRRLVYELARQNLKKETSQRDSSLTPTDIRESGLALETAIARVEADSSRAARADMRLPRLHTMLEPPDDAMAQERLMGVKPWRPAGDAAPAVGPAAVVPLHSSLPQAANPAEGQIWPRRRRLPTAEALDSGAELVAAPAERAPMEIVYPERESTSAARLRRRVWLWFIGWPLVQLVGLIVFGLALYMGFAGRLGEQSAQSRQAGVVAAQQSPSVEVERSSGLPLPSTYGVYAISNGALNELQPLPIRAPDPRVQLSAEINQPSSSVLPGGNIVFILFRRELMASAPQKVSVRVVARLASTLTFSSGKAEALKPGASWRIRSNSYDFQVSPLHENREMVVARPVDADFAFPAGRYALVLAGTAYDFSVDGPITAAAQCLESFEAVSGPVFSECRTR